MSDGGGKAGGSAFRYLYALAFLGAHLAFMPLLLLLLPRRVERLAGGDATTVLSLLLILGAATASAAHVAAGHASDRWMARRGQRRVPIAIGLALLMGAYAVLAAAASVTALAAAMVLFQIALNAMFSPLGALLSDHVEDVAKARTSAWLNLALPLSIASCGPLALQFPEDGTAPFVAVALGVLACVLPLLLWWPVGAAIGSVDDSEGKAATLPLADFRRVWAARFLVQCGAALMLFYLYVYLRQLPAEAGVPDAASRALSLLSLAGGLAGAAGAFAMGRLSDRMQRRRWPIAASGLVAAAALLVLAAQPAWPLVVTAYALFSMGLMTFLSLDNALVAQMLAGHPARGRWLGIMNLTNTLPGVATPLLTLLALQVASEGAITLLLGSLAVATGVAALTILRVRSVA